MVEHFRKLSQVNQVGFRGQAFKVATGTPFTPFLPVLPGRQKVRSFISLHIPHRLKITESTDPRMKPGKDEPNNHFSFKLIVFRYQNNELLTNM